MGQKVGGKNKTKKEHPQKCRKNQWKIVFHNVKVVDFFPYRKMVCQ